MTIRISFTFKMGRSRRSLPPRGALPHVSSMTVAPSKSTSDRAATVSDFLAKSRAASPFGFVARPASATSPPPQPVFSLFGVTPIWGNTHRDLLKETQSGAAQPSLVWLPESEMEYFGLTIRDPDAPRVTSSWGDLISGDATSDPSLLCYEAFKERRLPLKLCGANCDRLVTKSLQRLMIDAPSEFPSLYWGHAAEFAHAGATLLPGAHAVECVDLKGNHFQQYNAGQTSKPDFFTPESCVAYTPFLVPEMRHEYTALSYYWDVVLNRGRFKFCDEWFTEGIVKSHGIRLTHGARCVNGRYNMWDAADMKQAIDVKDVIRRKQSGRMAECDLFLAGKF